MTKVGKSKRQLIKSCELPARFGPMTQHFLICMFTNSSEKMNFHCSRAVQNGVISQASDHPTVFLPKNMLFKNCSMILLLCSWFSSPFPWYLCIEISIYTVDIHGINRDLCIYHRQLQQKTASAKDRFNERSLQPETSATKARFN